LRSKRFLDLTVCFLFLLGLPVLVFAFKRKVAFIRILFRVLFRKRTWVGFIPREQSFKDPQLPTILQGVLTPNPLNEASSASLSDKLNVIYARDYSVLTDVRILAVSFRKLDQES